MKRLLQISVATALGAALLSYMFSSATAQPMPTCSPGQSCKVLSLTATKTSGLGLGLTGDAGVHFGDGTIQNTAATAFNGFATNYVSSAGANTMAFAAGDGGMFCYTSDCSAREQVDGGISGVTQTNGLFSQAPILDTSGNSAFTLRAASPSGGGLSSATLWQLFNQATSEAKINSSGGMTAGSYTATGGSSSFVGQQYTGSGNNFSLLSTANDGAGVVGIVFGSIGGFSATGGGVMVSWRNNTNATAEFGYTLPNGVGSLWMQHPVTGPGKRTGEYTITLNTDTTFTATKLPSPTLYAAGVATSSPTADGTLNMIDYPTLGVSGNAAGINGPYTTTRFDFRPRLTAVIRTGSSIANNAIYVGVSDADASALVTLADFGAHRFVGAVYSAAGGDWSSPGSWNLLTSDGTTATASNSGVAVAADTTYVIDIDVSRAGKAILRINNVASTTSGSGGYAYKTTNIPTGVTNVGISLVNLTSANAVKDLYAGKVAMESN